MLRIKLLQLAGGKIQSATQMLNGRRALFDRARLGEEDYVPARQVPEPIDESSKEYSADNSEDGSEGIDKHKDGQRESTP